jgi:Fe-coproporphyrin III synthase
MNIFLTVLKLIDTKMSRFLNKTPLGPSVVHLEVTKRCNLKCQMCDIWKDYIKNPSLAKEELTLKHYIQLAKELKRMKVAAVGITGGEPSLKVNIIEIVKAFKRRDIAIHMNTNGTTISRIIPKLAEAKIDSVTVSIDSFGQTHNETRGVPNTFEKAIKTLKELKQSGIKRVGIGTLIMGQDPEHLRKLTLLAKDLGVYISFAGFDVGLIKDNVQERKKEFRNVIKGIKMINKLRKIHPHIIVLPSYLKYMVKQTKNPKKIKWCYAGFSTCIIESNGNVKPCYQYPVIGNIKDRGFKKVWHSYKMQSIRKRIKSGCVGCFANCTIEPSIVFSSTIAAFEFYKLKWSKIKK